MKPKLTARLAHADFVRRMHEAKKEELKAKMREYNQKPEVKAKQREYSQKPEVKDRHNDRENMKKICKEYNALMQKMGDERLSVREMRRLEAIAEYLGRDIDEWRTEQQKKEHIELMRR